MKILLVQVVYLPYGQEVLLESIHDDSASARRAIGRAHEDFPELEASEVKIFQRLE